MTILAKAMLIAAVSARTFTAGGVTIAVVYDSASSKYQFNVTNVTASATFTIVFSPSAATTQSDLAVFSAIGSGTLSDKWGTLTSSSTTGDTASWSNTSFTKNSDGSYNWTGSRAAVKVDSTKDTSITCGGTNNFSWANKVGTTTTTGTWDLETNADCSVVEPPAENTPAASANNLVIAASVATVSVMMTLF